MKELLQSYSIEEIIIFVSLLLLAAKEVMSTLDFFSEKNQNLYERKQNEKMLNTTVLNLSEQMTKIQATLNMLCESDKDDIKAWLVDKLKYYKAHPEEKIDDYTLDTIERRYKHYVEEGGNSYIKDNVIVELRNIAKGGTKND